MLVATGIRLPTPLCPYLIFIIIDWLWTVMVHCETGLIMRKNHRKWTSCLVIKTTVLFVMTKQPLVLYGIPLNQ